MPQLPPDTPSDWYLLVPIPGDALGDEYFPVGGFGAAQIYGVAANDMDDAVAWGHAQGLGACVAVLGVLYDEPQEAKE